MRSESRLRLCDVPRKTATHAHKRCCDEARWGLVRTPTDALDVCDTVGPARAPPDFARGGQSSVSVVAQAGWRVGRTRLHSRRRADDSDGWQHGTAVAFVSPRAALG